MYYIYIYIYISLIYETHLFWVTTIRKLETVKLVLLDIMGSNIKKLLDIMGSNILSQISFVSGYP